MKKVLRRFGITLLIIFLVPTAIVYMAFIAKGLVSEFFLSHKAAAELILFQDGFFYAGEDHPRPKKLIQLVEKDPHGRKMYRYASDQANYFNTALNDFYEPASKVGKDTVVYIIAQKKSLQKVYFYKGESLCFITDGIADDELEAFKEQNDWGRPLTLEKATVAHSFFQETVWDYRPENEDVLIDALGEKVGKENLDGFFYAIYDEHLKPVYLLRESYSESGETITFIDSYVFSADANNKIIDYELLSDHLSEWPKQIKAFRKTQGTVLCAD